MEPGQRSLRVDGGPNGSQEITWEPSQRPWSRQLKLLTARGSDLARRPNC